MATPDVNKTREKALSDTFFTVAMSAMLGALITLSVRPYFDSERDGAANQDCTPDSSEVRAVLYVGKDGKYQCHIQPVKQFK